MIQQFCDWLESTWLSKSLADLGWFVPAVQTIHILAIACVVILLAVSNFRLLNLVRGGPSAQDLVVGYVPWVWRALAVLLITGILLTLVEPARELMNVSFRVKMLLVLLLIALTFISWRGLRRSADYWTSSPRRRSMGRWIAAGSLCLCVSIIVAGRLIAYV